MGKEFVCSWGVEAGYLENARSVHIVTSKLINCKLKAGDRAMLYALQEVEAMSFASLPVSVAGWQTGIFRSFSIALLK